MRSSVHLCQRKFLHKHLRFSIHVSHVSFIPSLVAKSYAPRFCHARLTALFSYFCYFYYCVSTCQGNSLHFFLVIIYLVYSTWLTSFFNHHCFYYSYYYYSVCQRDNIPFFFIPRVRGTHYILYGDEVFCSKFCVKDRDPRATGILNLLDSSTKIQILTPEELCQRPRPSNHRSPQFTWFTSTKIQILTYIVCIIVCINYSYYLCMCVCVYIYNVFIIYSICIVCKLYMCVCVCQCVCVCVSCTHTYTYTYHLWNVCQRLGLSLSLSLSLSFSLSLSLYIDR